MKYIYIFIRPALGIFGLATLYVVGCHDQVSTGSSCGGASPRFCTPSFGDPLGPGRLLLLVNSSEISDDQSDSKSNTPQLFRCKTSIVKEEFDMVIWVNLGLRQDTSDHSRLKHNLTASRTNFDYPCSNSRWWAQIIQLCNFDTSKPYEHIFSNSMNTFMYFFFSAFKSAWCLGPKPDQEVGASAEPPCCC